MPGRFVALLSTCDQSIRDMYNVCIQTDSIVRQTVVNLVSLHVTP